MSNNDSTNAVSLSDHSTRRDSDGNRLPGWQHVSFLGGDIEVIALDNAQKQDVNDSLETMDEKEGDEEVIPSDLSARIFNDVVRTPHPKDDDNIHVDEFTTEYVSEDLHEDLELGYWVAIFRESGMRQQADYFEAVGEMDADEIVGFAEKMEKMGKLEEMEQAQT